VLSICFYDPKTISSSLEAIKGRRVMDSIGKPRLIDTSNIPKIITKRVLEGTHWLDKHASKHWRRNMFNVCEYATFRAKDSYDSQCVLALAFEHEEKFAGKHGYTSFYKVRDHFNLSERCVALGFAKDPGAKDPAKYSDLLNRAWEWRIRISGSQPHVRHFQPTRREDATLVALLK